MLIARALLAKIRPPRLNPREIQDQVDITRAAVLTAAYAVGRQHAHGDETCSYEILEKEMAALKPLARKLRVQTAINDQVSANSLALQSCLPARWPRFRFTESTPGDPYHSNRLHHHRSSCMFAVAAPH